MKSIWKLKNPFFNKIIFHKNFELISKSSKILKKERIYKTYNKIFIGFSQNNVEIYNGKIFSKLNLIDKFLNKFNFNHFLITKKKPDHSKKKKKKK